MPPTETSNTTYKDDPNGYRSVISQTEKYGTFELYFYRGFVSSVSLWPDGYASGKTEIGLYAATDTYDLPPGMKEPDPDSKLTVGGGTYKLGIGLAIDNTSPAAGESIQAIVIALKTDPAMPGKPVDNGGVTITADEGGLIESLDVVEGFKASAAALRGDAGDGDDGDTDPVTVSPTLVINEDAITCPPICKGFRVWGPRRGAHAGRRHS
jgi:hypothetical protein